MPVSARVEQYKALVELKKQGLAKHVGVSNFTDKHIQDLLDAGLVRTIIRSCSSACCVCRSARSSSSRVVVVVD
jgi:aryl-alcohol dehydrogenase-like predicted oxidoreductase